MEAEKLANDNGVDDGFQVSDEESSKFVIFDHHTHTRLCKHAAVKSSTDWIDVAARQHYKGFGICCHNPFPGDVYDIENRMSETEWPKFLEIRDNVKEYAKKHYPWMQIVTCLEVCYVPELWFQMRQFLEKNCSELDALLGSVHFGLYDVWEYMEKQSVKDIMAAYMTQWECAARSGMFQIMSHPNYYRINMRPRLPENNPEDEEYENKVFERMVKVAKEQNIALEFNTAGYKYGYRVDTLMDRKLVRLCVKENVPIVLSSDAHFPENVGKIFDEALALLKEEGVNELSYFVKKVRYTYSIDDAIRSRSKK